MLLSGLDADEFPPPAWPPNGPFLLLLLWLLQE